jgi:tetratricopeptide (TPR) repeat protein
MLLVFTVAFVSHAKENKGRTYFDIGVFALQDGDYQKAETNFIKALDQNPNNPVYHHYLGKTYLQAARYAQAEEHLTRAEELEPDLSELQYDIAYLYYKMENYSRAAERFKTLVITEPDNVLAHYQCGISLYKQRQYAEALDFFVAASEMSPTIKANGYYYAGICLLNLGNYDQAIERLAYVEAKADSELLKDHAIRWLNVIERQKVSMKRYRLYLKIGYQYDSNVTLDPIDTDIIADEDDFLTLVYLSGSYNFINRKRFVVGAGYNHYQTLHNRLTEYDLIAGIGSIYGRYRTGQFLFSLTYFPHYYWLDTEDYLRRHQWTPDITWRINRDLITRLSYSYYDNDYFQSDDRDGHTHEPVLSAYYFFNNRNAFVFGSLGYEDYNATSPDQYYEQVKLRGGLSLKIPWKLTLYTTVRYYDKNYNHVNSIYNVEREDDKFNGTIALSRQIVYEWLILTGEFDYTKNNSNIDDYGYRRYRGTLSLAAKF